MQKSQPKRPIRPPQHQARQPGIEAEMKPRPEAAPTAKPGDRRLRGKVALVTGGDSGIGRAVALLFAREGADIVFSYLNEHRDARETCRLVETEGAKCFSFPGDLGDEKICQKLIRETVGRFKRLDVLVNNAAEQHLRKDLTQITARQLERTFRTNIFAYFFLTKAALKHLKRGSAIINTTSVTAYRGSRYLLDYAATKGAIVSFTRSLSAALVERGIRVNGVAPGPIWTPLIPASFEAKQVEKFGSDVPMKRAGEPREVAPCYLFLATDDSAYMTGQILHPNGGEIVNG